MIVFFSTQLTELSQLVNGSKMHMLIIEGNA